MTLRSSFRAVPVPLLPLVGCRLDRDKGSIVKDENVEEVVAGETNGLMWLARSLAF